MTKKATIATTTSVVGGQLATRIEGHEADASGADE